ncbi:MAG: Gfo/Idh/MocA family oxidoreductase [Silicimonas sp.]|nr:Gfo/Idh/MocA family oxidoreductase [Silicimonas sp.]
MRDRDGGLQDMAGSQLKIVVVGAGLIGRTHIALVQSHAQLAAIVDPSPAAQALAGELHVPFFGALEDCLEVVHPDGVIVASPNTLHLEHGAVCLEAEIPVLVEKPLADTADAARRLVELSEATGVPLLVGHHRRHSEVIKAAKSVIESGRLGRLVAANALFWLHKPADYFQAAWRRQAGAGPSYINLIHDVDLLQHLCGPVRSVKAVESSAVRGFDVEDTAAAVLTFASGALGTVSICDTVSAPWSWEMTSGENPVYPKCDQSCYLLAGTGGSLSLPDLTVWSHAGEQSWWSPMDRERIEVEARDPVEAQLLHFLDVIAKESAPLVSARDGLRNIAVVDALKAAAGRDDAVTVETG